MNLHCKKILEERGYKNFENLNNIKQKFDLIIVTHALEHITDVNYIFNKFNDLLVQKVYILRCRIVRRNTGMVDPMMDYIYYTIQKKVWKSLPEYIISIL